ncbi:MAG: DUF5596 domain-containing protein [Clostridia bacterium]|nr:DUF5596 domain-containing protein [Clostridia bacterium]
MIIDIARKIEFPEEAIASLSLVLNDVTAKGKLPALYDAMDDWYIGSVDDWGGKMAKIAEETGVNRYALDMVFLLLAAKPLAYLYRINGLADELYLDIMRDLRYKLVECKQMHNVWGIFVAWWFPWHYQLKRFALGRLQYERIEARFDDEALGVKKGDIVYNCHIPNSGPMTPESIRESLRKAYQFFKPELNGGRMVVTCCSWLLYTPLVEQYSEHSNIKKFHDLFHIVNIHHNDTNHDFWRLFYTDYSKEALGTVKAETSLQKIVLAHLQNGGTMGEGTGYLILDETF